MLNADENNIYLRPFDNLKCCLASDFDPGLNTSKSTPQGITTPFLECRRSFKFCETKIEEEDLMYLMHLECELLRPLLLMRKTGTKIDTKQRDLNGLELKSRSEQLHIDLIDQVGFNFNFNSSKQLAMYVFLLCLYR